MKKLAIVIGVLAATAACDTRFQGELGRIGFSTNLVDWAPSRPVARGAPMRVTIDDVTSNPTRWDRSESRGSGDLEVYPVDEHGFEVADGRGRIDVRVFQGADAVSDHFGVRFEDPREVLANGASRLGVVAGAPCAVDLSVHGRRGARIGHDPEALDVAADGDARVWEAEGHTVEVEVADGVVARLDVRYGDFGPVPAPEIVGVAAADLARVSLQAVPYEGNVLLVPIGEMADGTEVACVPVRWEIPSDLPHEAADPDANGQISMILVQGDEVPDGVRVSIAR